MKNKLLKVVEKTGDVELHTYYGNQPYRPYAYTENGKTYIPLVVRDRCLDDYYEVSWVFQELKS